MGDRLFYTKLTLSRGQSFNVTLALVTGLKALCAPQQSAEVSPPPPFSKSDIKTEVIIHMFKKRKIMIAAFISNCLPPFPLPMYRTGKRIWGKVRNQHNGTFWKRQNCLIMSIKQTLQSCSLRGLVTSGPTVCCLISIVIITALPPLLFNTEMLKQVNYTRRTSRYSSECVHCASALHFNH